METPSPVKSRASDAARRVLGPMLRPIRRLVRFLGWIFPSLGRLLVPTPASERRLLLVYDTYSQPFNIGDVLLMQEGALVLREKHGIDLVDFAIVYDPKRRGHLAGDGSKRGATHQPGHRLSNFGIAEKAETDR